MSLRAIVTPSRYSFARYVDDPFLAIQHSLHKSLDDLWANHPSSATEAAALSIRLDVKEDKDAFYITADLPGLNEKAVEVTFDEGLLTIRGEKKIEREVKNETWHVTERSHGSFARQLSLPTNICSDKIQANFDKGVLNITLPKLSPEQNSARKIEVKAV